MICFVERREQISQPFRMNKLKNQAIRKGMEMMDAMTQTGHLIIALSSICQLCRSRTDHEICPIIDDNAMTRRRGLTLTLDQLTRTNPLRVTLSLCHPRSVVQCYCTYMCQVNSHIDGARLYTGWIVPVGMQFHDYMAKQLWMSADVLNQWHAEPVDLGIVP